MEQVINKLLSSAEVVKLKCTARFRPHQMVGELLVTNERILWLTGDTGEKKADLPWTKIKSTATNPPQKNHDYQKASIWLGANQNAQEPPFWVFDVVKIDTMNRYVPDWDKREAILQWIKKFIQPISSLQSRPNQLNLTGATPSSSRMSSSKMGSTSASELRKQNNEAAQQRRLKVLAGNSDIRKLYEEFVTTGIVTPEDFWRQHASDLLSEQSKEQATGLQSAFLADVRLTSENKLKITPVIIQSIFMEEPEIKALYEKKVPDEMSENEFWSAYYRALQFSRFASNRYRAANMLGQQNKDEFLTSVAEAPRFREPSLISQSIDDELDVSVNVAAEPSEGFPEEYGTYIERERDTQALTNALPVIRRYNRHSSTVLKTHDVEEFARLQHDDVQVLQKRKLEVRSYYADPLRSSIEDLQPDPLVASIPLNITNQSLYFDNKPASSASAPIDTTARAIDPEKQKSLAIFRSQLSNSTQSQKLPTNTNRAKNNNNNNNSANNNNHENNNISPEQARTVLNELILRRRRTGDDEIGNLQSMSPEVRNQLLHFFATSTELLRHFWSRGQLISTPEEALKVHRIVQKMEEIYGAIGTYKKQNIAYSPVMIPIEAALDRGFDQWEKIRAVWFRDQ